MFDFQNWTWDKWALVGAVVYGAYVTNFFRKL